VAPYETASLTVAVVLGLVTLGGLVARRKVVVCWTFMPYLATVALGDLLVLLWPEHFYRQWFWVVREQVTNVLRFGVALELAYRTFRAFPAARASVRAVALLVMALTLGIVSAGASDLPADGPVLQPLISQVLPRILNGTIWLLTAVAALILWYRLPVHPWHKAVLTGLVGYLLVFSTSLSWIGSQGWGVRPYANVLQIAAFLLLLTYWAVAAWRRAEVPLRPGGEDGSHAASLHRAAG
jgi:hypothetical protein